MAEGKDTIWERFLAPVVRLLTDEESQRQFYSSIDWEKSSDRFLRPQLVYPDYYSTQNIHSIKGGYLNAETAVSYDPITQYALPPNETLVRQGLIDAVRCQPRRILDIGCGTGSMTLMLKQAFPRASVIGLDLSPYMLVVAEHKALKAGIDINFVHGNAERTGFPDASFDLVTGSLLFHETPTAVSRGILRESHRLLKVGGEVVVLDRNQKILQQADWLNDIFELPYIRDYACGSVDAWMEAAGFGAVQTSDLWMVHQVSRGVKPIPGEEPKPNSRGVAADGTIELDPEGVPAPVFGISV